MITILKKEIVDILRDKKTLFMMVCVPLLLYPILLLGITFIMNMVSSLATRFDGKSQNELLMAIYEEAKKGNVILVIDVFNGAVTIIPQDKTA